MNPILAGISVFAAYFSVLGYISSPGEYVQYGPLVMIVGPLAHRRFPSSIGWWGGCSSR